MADILYDAGIWVLAAFLILMAIVGRRGIGALYDFLDNRAQTIQNRMNEAAKLQADAESLLAAAVRLQQESHERSRAILHHAEEECERLRRRARQDMAAFIQTEERLMTQRIAHQERAALHEIESKAMDQAVISAHNAIQKIVEKEGDARFVAENSRHIRTFNKSFYRS